MTLSLTLYRNGVQKLVVFVTTHSRDEDASSLTEKSAGLLYWQKKGVCEFHEVSDDLLSTTSGLLHTYLLQFLASVVTPKLLAYMGELHALFISLTCGASFTHPSRLNEWKTLVSKCVLCIY